MNRRHAFIMGGTLLTELRLGNDGTSRMLQQEPPIPSEIVRDFVRAAHADPSAVRIALQGRPALANACWDWGAGDFETALGAATHMGRRDIADLLLAAGARPDLFTAIVLRDLDLLAAQLRRSPSLVLTKGPHGLTLDSHAKATGDPDVVRRVGDIVVEARAALR